MVLKGSIGRRANAPSIVGTSDERSRQKLLGAKVMREEGETVVFLRDHLFGSPSAAATALLEVSANGWKAWTDASGRTLKEAKRGAAEVVG